MIKELKELKNSDMYPFHMPGPKRNMSGYPFEEAYNMDITEIDGFDNLQDPEGLIKEIEIRAAEYMHCSEAHILVNGSTCGVLAAISSLVPHHGTLLMARNSHQSAYNAALIGELNLRYLFPELIPDYCLNGGIKPEKVEEALSENRDISAVYITSPTYEGIISDIPEIAKTAHKHGVPLIVDSAHGAHLDICSEADAVIVSLHKTLPAFTSTALCLLNGDIIDRRKVRQYINIFQTSSPSYVLIAGVENCFDILENEGEERFAGLHSKIASLRGIAERLENIHIIGSEFTGIYAVKAFDESKLLLTDTSGNLGGRQLYDVLRDRYHLQPEMSEGRICLCMTSIMDTEEGFGRLENAIKEIDDDIRSGKFRK